MFMILDLDGMSCRLDKLPFATSHLHRDLFVHVRRRPVIANDRVGGQFRVHICQRPDAAQRLAQADKKQAGMVGMEYAQVQRHIAFGIINQALIEKGKGDDKTGCRRTLPGAD